MTITLPDSMKGELEQEAQVGGFGTVDEYILFMYLRAKYIFGPNAAERTPEAPSPFAEFAPAKPAQVSREQLARLIHEALDCESTARPTPEFWDRLQRRVQERLESGAWVE